MRYLLPLALIPLLAACALSDLTAPRDVGNANRLTLHATQEAQEPKQKRGTISIQLPEAPSNLDTYRIAVTLPDGRDDYIAGARWNDFLPSVLQEALRDNFAQSHVFLHTNEDVEITNSRYQLRVEIRNFSAIYSEANQPPTVKVKLGFVLQRGYGQAVTRFSTGSEAAATANSLTAIHEAFDQAFNEASQQALNKIAAATK